MKNEVYILLEYAGPTTETVTEKMIGSGYHNNDGVHTVQYVFDNFVGHIVLQGTLETEPDNYTDWADIHLTRIPTVKKELEYEYESEYQNEYEYEYQQKVDTTTTPVTGTVFLNFFGNFVWIRAKYKVDSGSIDRVVFNF